MKFSHLLALVIILNISCNDTDELTEIVIEGNISNFPDGKLYLTDAHDWEIPLDSTEIKNGKFFFKIKDSSFVPFKASIKYADSSSRTGVNSFFFRNHTLPDSTRHFNGAFMLERGRTWIIGDFQSKEKLRVFAGREHELFYSGRYGGFGELRRLDSSRRLRRIAYYEQEIKKHPYSYLLLHNLFNAKTQYEEKEFVRLFSLFDSEVRASALGDKVNAYLRNRPDPGSPAVNLYLTDMNNNRDYIIDKERKLNMVVFWASWCGPCRQEIPDIKYVYSKYNSRGLKLISVSIDENVQHWKKALAEEKMDWPQYIVDKDKIDLVMQQYNFSGIPLVVFINKSGIEIKRFLGSGPEAKANFEKVIQEEL